MLKLEKNSRRGEINITMRDRHRFWNLLIAQAFGIALAWHLAVLVIFHVGGLKILGGNSPLKTIAVNADITVGSSDENILAQAVIEEEKKHRDFVLAPALSELAIPEINIAIPALSFQFDQPDDLESNPFQLIEEDVQDEYFAELATPKKTPPFQIHVSGPLSQRLISDFYEIGQFGNPPDTIQKWVFEIQIHDPEGSIIQYQPKDPIDPQYDKLADRILSTLKFVPSKEQFVTSGEVEIVFNPQGSS